MTVHKSLHTGKIQHSLWCLFCAGLVCLLIAFSSSVTAYAASCTNNTTGYSAVIEDDADLLTAEEEQLLLEQMKDITEYGNAAFVTIDSNPYSSTERFAESYSEENFYNSPAITFVIDMDNRYLYIDSYGSKMRKYITSSRADTITDNIYYYAKDEEYYVCAQQAFEQIYAVLQGQRIAQPMKYISNALLAFALSMLILFIIIRISSSKRKATDKERLSGVYNSVKLYNPDAKFTHQTKTYSPQSSSSSGGGGGGHSGGGGGGGHSGGGHSF